MSLVRIGLDCDGVLCDFNSAYIQLIKEELGVDLPPVSDTYPNKWDYLRDAGVTRELESTLWEKIKVSRSFWYRLNHFEGTVKFLHEVTNTFGPENIWFITARVGDTAQKQTEMWVRQYGARNPQVIVSKEKGKHCVDLSITHYIDDKNENCAEVVAISPNTKVYMLARPWNQQQEGIPRLESLRQFMDELNKAVAE